MSRGELIAQGRTAEIYAWGSGRVVKLYRAGYPAAAAEQEAAVTRLVRTVGVPAPAVEDVLALDGRPGIVFERLQGPSLLDVILARPWALKRWAHLLADLHTTMHERSLPALRPQRSRLEASIRRAAALAPEERTALLSALALLPNEQRLCHGDFHPGNVILTGSGPVIIDWVDAAAGHSLVDVARTTLLIQLGRPSLDTLRRRLLQRIRSMFLRAYIRRYLARRPGAVAEITRWRPIVAAARLAEGVPGEDDRLLAVISGLKG